MVGGPRVVVVSGVIDILAVRLFVRVLFDVEFCVVGEEQAVPCAVFLVFRVLLVSERLVVRVHHGALSHIHRFPGNHCGEGSHIGA